MKLALKIILGCLGICAFFVLGDFAERYFKYRPAWGGDAAEAAMRTTGLSLFQRMPHPWDDAALEKCGLPVYDLKIGPKEFAQLRATAEEVSAAKYSEGILLDYVPAKFLYDGHWADVDVKLRGKTSAHYSSQRPSLRLKFPGTHLFNSMEQINLLRAVDKGITKDLTTNWELGRLGILTLPSQFVVLRINGEMVGVFQEIEQFGRGLMDRARRSEGYVFSGLGEQFANAPGEAFWDQAGPVTNWFLACQDQADAPPNAGPCTWDRVDAGLDTDKYAWAMAMATLLGSTHACSYDNTRAYFDPPRGKCEPIPWDYLGYPIDTAKSPDGETAIFLGASLLRLPEFRRMRDERLWTLMTERLEPMIDHANEEYAKLEAAFHADHASPKEWREREIHEEYLRVLRDNSAFLTSLMNKHDLTASVYREDDGRLILGLSNQGKAHVSIQKLTFSHDAQSLEVPLREPIVVEGAWKGKPGWKAIELASHTETTLPDGELLLASVDARNEITKAPLVTGDVKLGQARPAGVAPLAKATAAPPENEELPENVRRTPQGYEFGPGPVRLSKNWEIPRGRLVTFLPGLDLRMTNKAALILSGDLIAKGTAEKPIYVGGLNSKEDWGALAVQGTRVAKVNVVMEYVTIEGGTGAKNERSTFLGAYSVTDGNVTLRKCQFLDGAAIDGLNLKYCDVLMEGNYVKGTKDDAIDFDFCTGKVVGNVVEHSGGDGIDFSGSEVEASSNRLMYCNDKGISIGEMTNAKIFNNVMIHCRTGFASKDGSQVTADGIGIPDVTTGVAIYRKKLTYPAPHATLNGIVMLDVTSPFHKGPDSDLTIQSTIRHFAAGTPTARHEGLTLDERPAPAKEEEIRPLLTRAEGAEWGVTHPETIPWDNPAKSER